MTRADVGLARLALYSLARQTATQRQALLARTRQRVHAGIDSRVELRQAGAGLPDARSQIDALDGQITLTRHQLVLLSGQEAVGLWVGPALSLTQRPPRAVPGVAAVDAGGAH